MAVDVDLAGEGTPGLQADVEQAGLAIEEVEVEEEARAPRRTDGRPPVATGEPEAAAGFDRRET
jgi:hypothetical protein